MRRKKSRDTLEQSYLLFKSINPDIKVDKRTYKRVCYRMNQLIAEFIVDTGLEYTLPYKLGKLQIRKRKMKFFIPKVDFGEYQKTKIVTYHLNEHSLEYYAYCHWSIKSVKLINKSCYKFNLSRDNKRTLAQRMKDGITHQKYQVDIKYNKNGIQASVNKAGCI